MRNLLAGVWLVLIVVLVVSVPLTALAQEATEEAPAEETTRPWSNEGELMFVNTSGNSAATNFAIRDKFTYNFTYGELIVHADLIKATARDRDLYNEGGGVRQVLTTRTTSEQYEVGAKYRQNFLDQAFWYALATWYSNDPAGISTRLSGGGGVGYRFVENDSTTLVGEAGLALTHESPVSGESDTFIDARVFGEWQQRITGNSDLSLAAEFIDNLQDFDQLRINTRAAVTASITKVLALRLSWDMKFNNAPPGILVTTNLDEPPAYFQLKTTDRVLGASLVFTF